MSENQQPESIEVFISYSHDSEEHKRKVLALADQLVRHDLDVTLDLFEENGTSDEGWPLWMEKAIERATFVLIVRTETYLRRSKNEEEPGKGAGVRWESIILYNTLCDPGCKLSKFVPIGFEDQFKQWIPKPLRGVSYYPILDDDCYFQLYRVFTQQPEFLRPLRGEKLQLPPKPMEPLFSSGENSAMAGKYPAYTPNYGSAADSELGERLDKALELREELAISGKDLTRFNEEILELKRKMRSGVTLKAGESLGNDRFRLVDVIGHGGFATVWKAYDRQEKMFVAIKVLHGQYAHDRSRKERFFRGAAMMAKLQHHNIVKVIEKKIEEEGIYFFVMEYIEGLDLQHFVLEKGAFSVEKVVGIVTATGNGLSHSHKHKVIHRDIKPSNILIGQDGEVKLTDFDLVKAADTTGGTRTGGMGTIIYAAPEMGTDAKSATPRADVYGLAMTTIFALQGQDLLPFIYHGVGHAVESLRCRDLVKKCWPKEPRWSPMHATQPWRGIVRL